MLILIVAGVLLGQFLDKKFETDKLFTAICSLFFVLASIYLALKDFIKK
ncbi:MAG: AtpZ/AtpI family protein [Chitinophagales bacterium]|nr:AtpZ/AtpI family protein [Chitinophagales bacterium]